MKSTNIMNVNSIRLLLCDIHCLKHINHGSYKKAHVLTSKIVSECDQEIPQSETADKPVAS